jgi:hypothetical protein
MYEPVTQAVKTGYRMEDRGYILVMGKTFPIRRLTQQFVSNFRIFLLIFGRRSVRT